MCDLVSFLFEKRYVFDAIDQNGNGEIDFLEYMVAMSLQTSGSLKDKLHWMFNLYDLDKSGSLEISEMIKIINSMYAYLGRDTINSRGTIKFDKIEKLFNKVRF